MKHASAQAGVLVAQTLPDLRFGFAPLPPPLPGYDPAGDALALMLAGVPSPAQQPIAGVQYAGSYAPDERFVIRVPARWNGSLIVAGTPATRSEFANDLIWSDFGLARGFAFASSNKGVPYNAIAEPAAAVIEQYAAYPVPFDAGGWESEGIAWRLGMLAPRKIPISAWNDDYAKLIAYTKNVLAERHAAAQRVYAVGLSNGGAQVRTLLEQHPDLVDGGVEWAGVYWSPQRNMLDALPVFLREMPAYIASGFQDVSVVDTLEAQGFPRDVIQADPAHPSLYAEYYSNVAPFYADLTVFAYASLIDPDAGGSFGSPPCIPNRDDPQRLPGTCMGNGLAIPVNRAAYVPSAATRDAIRAFAHSGSIGKPLISIAGTHDVFIPPLQHAVGYAQAVQAAGRGALHSLFLVAGGTHVDSFVAFGYGLQPQAPFAWAAFDRLVRVVENGASMPGGTQVVSTPGDLT